MPLGLNLPMFGKHGSNGWSYGLDIRNSANPFKGVVLLFSKQGSKRILCFSRVLVIFITVLKSILLENFRGIYILLEKFGF